MGQFIRVQGKMKCQILTALLCIFISNVNGHTKGTDAYAYLDFRLPVGTYCGPQRPITAWEVLEDRWVAATTGTITNNAQYSNGVFTTQVEGTYHCCVLAGDNREGFMIG